jgi:hypothetical protein
VEEEGQEKRLLKKNKLEANKKAPGAATDNGAAVNKVKKESLKLNLMELARTREQVLLVEWHHRPRKGQQNRVSQC